MRDIMRAGGSDHIVKLYKSAYSEGGSGTSKARDPWPFTSGGKYRKKYQVSRLFMEYCENGNLASEIAEVVRNGYDLPEEYIWRAFECLASALVFLDHGNEETDDDAETWDSPISHFDIKPGNILIGTHDENHPRLPVLKLSDFGLGLPVPSQVRNAEKWQTWNRKRKRIWMEDAQWRATPGYIPPVSRQEALDFHPY
ncbi:hypothetical protein M430DRAFT_258096 [Amorphotheca resinae ATCC 22711]|uniref:Protein kinase domain-containing protein n=1 Tax=Amorphotheca resinae ATCC 22711 TaxID=857342 RepID=A0A2T3AYU2_AMORE|nr:hypothetical protein M430DRAFT_258096 [Amorphotheca resinae ATCC 22711]PSS15211.1 hypothetical protein M430DRAFT_258096 [Amorphotheca resinae ATCC 22711]